MKNKYLGICKVGEKGQIVIPKEARDLFDIKPGDTVVVLCDKKKGMAIVKSDIFESVADNILGSEEKTDEKRNWNKEVIKEIWK